jgi:putative component of membrane protein insertase Oxa1/YidC/SpoIIIJ protein YidD
LKEKPNKTKTVKFIEPSKDKKRITYNPLTYLGGAFLFFYQTLVSEQIQANCAYHLSCSHFTKISMQTKGAVLGFFIGLNQLSCCFGGVADDHELCAITFEGKVDNRPLNE